MPEGPECAIHAQSLHAALSGASLLRASILSGRYSGRARAPHQWSTLLQLLPAKVEAVHSKGKLIYWLLQPEDPQFEGELSLWSTLGMSGGWALERTAHSRVCLEIDAECGRFFVFYNDQRNFGVLTVCLRRAQLEAKLASLGPDWLGAREPIGSSAGARADGLPLCDFLSIVHSQCSNRRRAAVPVAKFLMDQKKTSGIGNYLLSEILFKARVYPWARCGALAEADWTRVHAAALETTRASYAAQSLLALDGDASAPTLSATRGTLTAIEPSFTLLVYRRERTACGSRVLRDTGPHGRSVFWVPEMQLCGREDLAELSP